MADPKGELSGVVHRNIRTMIEMRKSLERGRSRQERVADAVTRFTGSMRFVYFQAVLVSGWIIVNLGGIPGMRPFDPFPFVMLAMLASCEAIFLSTFVLISQNRQAERDEKRAELNLQISLLSEHEVTRLIQLIDSMMHHLKIDVPRPEDIEQIKKDVFPEKVLHEIDKAAS